MLFLPVLVAHFLYVSPRVGEPVVELSLRHACVEGQALLLHLGWIGVERMFLNPADKHSWISPSSDRVGARAVTRGLDGRGGRMGG